MNQLAQESFQRHSHLLVVGFLGFLFFQTGMVGRVFSAEPKPEDLLNPLKRFQAAAAEKAKKKIQSQKVVKRLVSPESQFEGVRLEGVARGAHGGTDIAILNGDTYRVGEEIKGYRIMEIHPSYVQVENQTTHVKRTIWVNGIPSKQEMSEIDFRQESVKETASPTGLSSKVSVWMAQLGWISKKNTDAVLIDLRRLDQAKDLMLRQKSESSHEVSVLIKNQYLPYDFVSGQILYDFVSDVDSVRADPKSQYTGLPHFFIGKDNLIRFEKKLPAGIASPLWDRVYNTEAKSK